MREDRIKEAETNVANHLKDNIIKKVEEPNQEAIKSFHDNAKESLKTAQILFKEKHSDLWTIVCSYYAMYYAANAALRQQGTKIGDKIAHKATADAIIVYLKDKLKEKLIEEYEETKEDALELAGTRSEKTIQEFDYERKKRNRFQYEMGEEVKRSKAQTSLNRAKKFVFEMERFIDTETEE